MIFTICGNKQYIYDKEIIETLNSLVSENNSGCFKENVYIKKIYINDENNFYKCDIKKHLNCIEQTLGIF